MPATNNLQYNTVVVRLYARTHLLFEHETPIPTSPWEAAKQHTQRHPSIWLLEAKLDNKIKYTMSIVHCYRPWLNYNWGLAALIVVSFNSSPLLRFAHHLQTAPLDATACHHPTLAASAESHDTVQKHYLEIGVTYLQCLAFKKLNKAYADFDVTFSFNQRVTKSMLTNTMKSKILLLCCLSGIRLHYVTLM